MLTYSKLDDLWRDKVKELAGYKCERCGSTDDLHSHHIIKRTYMPTRWLLANGICLCMGCHGIAHKDERFFKLWVKPIRPIEYLESLKFSTEKINKVEIEDDLNSAS